MNDKEPMMTQPDKKADRAEQKAKRKAARREAKADKKAARKEAYERLDRKGKIVYRMKRIGIALVLLLVSGTALFFLGATVRKWVVNRRVEWSLTHQASKEDILEKAKPDEKGDARIAQMEQYDKDDTWAIYVYICGSNLESNYIEELSEVTKYLTREEAQEMANERMAERKQRLTDFVSEIGEKGLDLPSFMYLPVKETQEDESEYEYYPAATMDIEEMLAVTLPENVEIVYQTGGASSWNKAGINPNRSQRFVYDSKGFREEEDNPAQDTGNADTLADFLRFCKKEHPADHKVLIFWDHGGGAFGFGSDELFGGDGLTLKEVREALGQVYPASEDNPPFEIIGFDACLMASLEVAESLNGYGRYLAASEELESGEGWDYTTWLEQLAEHPEMNSAQVGKAIVDSYVEYYANQSVQLGWMGIDNACTFSLIDIAGAHKVYEAYGEFASAALKDAIQNMDTLTILGKSANRSVRYGMNVYKIYNTIDLGIFMRNLSEEYPDETEKVLKALEEAVIYNRATSYEENSEGLSVYFPTDVEDIYGMFKYLEYINEVCDNQDIKALYYYKFAGCLNDELQAYADEKGYGKAKTLDTTPLKNLMKSVPELEEGGNFHIAVDEEQMSLIQDLSLDLFRVDEEEDKGFYYGGDQFLYLDEEGMIQTSFDGEWASIEGHFLSVEKIDETESAIKYRAPVSYNGKDSYLILVYDFEQEKMSIAGVIKMEESADTISRVTENVKSGSQIRPIYYVYDGASGSFAMEYGKMFFYKSTSRVEDKFLDDGKYVEFVTLKDTRGDKYYTQGIEFTVKNGKIIDEKLTDDYRTLQVQSENR